MTRYALFLRGINVGPKTVVPMAELRLELEKLGLSGVKTLLNSGNAVFESDLDAPALERMIEAALVARFGFPIPSLVRGAQELREAIDGLPFSSEQIEYAQAQAGEVDSLYVVFLSAPLTLEASARMEALIKPGEKVLASGRRLYLLLEHSIRECKLFAGMDKVDPRATTRNWNTAVKLDTLLGG